LKWFFRNQSAVKFPRQSSGEQRDQYWQEHGGVEVCEIGGNARFKKHWYSNEPEALSRHEGSDAPERSTTTCPACQMKKQNVFEGEIVISGATPEQSQEIQNLARNFDSRAKQEDPQDRILSIEDKKTLRITTSENQMAEKMGKKIAESFKRSTIAISHSKEPYEVSRITINFPAEE